MQAWGLEPRRGACSHAAMHGMFLLGLMGWLVWVQGWVAEEDEEKKGGFFAKLFGRKE